MVARSGCPHREDQATSLSSSGHRPYHNQVPSRRAFTAKITPTKSSHKLFVSTAAVVNYERPAQRGFEKDADTDLVPEIRRQRGNGAVSSSADNYVPLSEAQKIIERVVNASSPAEPKILSFLDSGVKELRFLNYGLNGTLVALSVLAAVSHLTSYASVPGPISTLFSSFQGLSALYDYLNDTHPIATKAVISGAVYGLGDLTAQTYEGRSWKEFDAARSLRSSLCGLIAYGPLSHFFYGWLDRTMIVSKYFDGGDAWFTPAAKIAVDQTAFAATWNSLYLVMLGALKGTSPGKIANTVKVSWWDNLKAGWRIWPLVHIITYTLIPCEDRVLWVNMVDLAWVTVLCFYGNQKRERAGAAACSLPGVAGEGGVFTDDILRSMTVESQIVFQRTDAEPVVKRLDEVLVEAALLEANFIDTPGTADTFMSPQVVSALSSEPAQDADKELARP